MAPSFVPSSKPILAQPIVVPSSNPSVFRPVVDTTTPLDVLASSLVASVANTVPTDVHQIPTSSNNHPMASRSKVGVYKPKAYTWDLVPAPYDQLFVGCK